MIPDVSKGLIWLQKNPDVIYGIKRGIERETLRVTTAGQLATSNHPEILGKALTHPWITTDFSESLLEFITPADSNIDNMLSFLTDIHSYVATNLVGERMWPMSMPGFIKHENNIILAKYGTSNIGQFKTVYRKGLKNRYGAYMQIISGIHYNFSLPFIFWQKWAGIKDVKSGKQQISAGYFHLIRNYYRFGWVIPYLFGASPAMCSSFLKNRQTNLPLKQKDHMLYLPYATSLRLSNLGYTNKLQNNLGIMFNSLSNYVTLLKKAIYTPYDKFKQIGIKVDGHYRQLNANILQIENELYAPIRPKCITKEHESLSEALLSRGIEYIEVRSLDVNPFTAIGVNEDQALFLEILLIWCILVDSPKINNDELLCIRKNWDRIILEGRKPGQTICIHYNNSFELLVKIGKDLFTSLQRVAKVLDNIYGGNKYYQVCTMLLVSFDDITLTYSAKILEKITKKGFIQFGTELSEMYYQELKTRVLSVQRKQELQQKVKDSIKYQSYMEAKDSLSDAISFEEYLYMHNQR
ncbi:Glutamate--cysteine ligase [Candidatus Profftia lariciata]|uniref:glutamate--cysteine ligase n=1 Tax=Candidatus Profftia lariciata TaxID=1987921 RepID=UPI001D008DF9|nr:glutamate--cysteine ligase [Candidatus Profftia lariciata]UDG81366.1 Glutamate--cysteine ligase [Candidatus Profftia lariciata]